MVEPGTTCMVQQEDREEHVHDAGGGGEGQRAWACHAAVGRGVWVHGEVSEAFLHSAV